MYRELLFAEGFIWQCSHILLGRDGRPSQCFLFYSYTDTLKVKGLIESEKSADPLITTSKLQELSELDRVLSSKTLCRRQSILGLLDDPSPPCFGTEQKCDNCIIPVLPAYRVVTDALKTILCFLNESQHISVYSLRRILAGLQVSIDVTSPVLGVFQQWTGDEISQFTDFLLRERYLVKKGIFVDDLPTHCLRLSLTSENLLLINDMSEVLFAVHESPIVKMFDGLSSIARSKCHKLNERRFVPKP